MIQSPGKDQSRKDGEKTDQESEHIYLKVGL